MLSFIENQKSKNKLFAFFILIIYGFCVGYNTDQNYNNVRKESLIASYYLGSLIFGIVLPTFFTNIKFDSLNLKLNYNTSIICVFASTIGCLLNLIVSFILLSFSVKYLNR